MAKFAAGPKPVVDYPGWKSADLNRPKPCEESNHPLMFDKGTTWTQYVHMKTATVRDLRNNFSVLEAWLSDGESVCIEKRGEPIAMLTAMPRTKRKAFKKTDFGARLKAIWGDRIFSETEVAAMREAELDGEEG